ncbi:Chitin synthase, class 3 [Linnemannia exigua]|uniref:chitin synthase n=1 Tax=Linnemannia exigua TaxID=604196 RepID=A0AAD4DHQ5_9FUNG|nr:Chitin synthase, class 3 [Linnemannia exigua]
MCPRDSATFEYTYPSQNGALPQIANHINHVFVRGSAYPLIDMKKFLLNSGRNIVLTEDFQGRDISALFYDNSMPCKQYSALNIASDLCTVINPYRNTNLVAKPCLPITLLTGSGIRPSGKLSFLWTDLESGRRELANLVIYDGSIFNVTNLIRQDDPLGKEVTDMLYNSGRRDVTLQLQRTDAHKQTVACLQAVSQVGVLENKTMGCVAAQVIMLTTLICVCMVVGIKFLMALTFSWFLSYRLTEKPRRPIKKAGKQGDEKDKDDGAGNGGQDLARGGKKALGRKNLYTAMLVTCYSEGENSIRTTLDSLANTSYSIKHKLIVVICDGIVRGHGNKMTTPDIVVNMLDLLPGNENPKAASYLAIADGEKQHNMAKVYGGHYVYKKRRVPTVVIVKCGNPLEKDASKPGNRGKRDSQLILMSFFQRVLFADRFTELDFELFHKMHLLMNVWPDQFELCLMVDADTMVKGDSLSYMVTAMQNDTTIMGLCGETKIANKTASWVTAIQVFEYYISHHLGKAFESVFGGVTCLPGCFCMYRIKAPKFDSWVPILANPEIIEEYNQNVVSTLHQKNLLLLGEDRYLTTLMLRTFPKRQMVFVPQAQCKTVVPDTFSVLLSQRRRWINSTIHNLLELVLVTDLCGIACLSMQFVVLLELIGTVVLPAAILFAIGMITYAVITQTLAILPLILIVAIIGLPAVLIVLTSRKWIYVLWMFMYLLSLPLWNFVLPLYAFWHFDDFSWGETRKVANQKRKSGQDHGDAEGVFESGSIIMRKWEEWEKERLKAMGYRIQKRHSADRGINDLPPPASSTMDLHQSPITRSSTVNLTGPRAKNQSQIMLSGPSISGGGSGSGSRITATAAEAVSTPSLGSTLNGSSGSLRAGTPTTGGVPRQFTTRPMPTSTPNATSVSQQQQQQQQQQQLQHRQSMGMMGGARPPRPRPPPTHMMARPQQPGPMAGPGPRASMGPDGQSFELGPMHPSSPPMPGRSSFMLVSGPGVRPAGGNVGGNGTVGLEHRHSIQGGPGPGYRPAPSPRPMHMRPMRPGPPPMNYPQQQQQGPPGAGGPRPRPPPGTFSAPIMQPPPPALLFSNYQQQQQQQQHHSQDGSSQSASGVLYPSVPSNLHSSLNQQALLTGDRTSRLSDMSGGSSGGRSAPHGSVATVSAPGAAGGADAGVPSAPQAHPLSRGGQEEYDELQTLEITMGAP